MVKIFITKYLEKQILKRLSPHEADEVFLVIKSLGSNPYKGDIITVVGNVILKELKFKKFRFYFIHSANILKILSEEELNSQLIKVIEMSDKSKEQQKVIDRIKTDLKSFGFEWYK